MHPGWLYEYAFAANELYKVDQDTTSREAIESVVGVMEHLVGQEVATQEDLEKVRALLKAIDTPDITGEESPQQ